MNFAIRYLTSYQYDGEVVDNLNALRVKPATTRPAALRRVRRAPDAGGPAAPPHRLLRHRGGGVRGLASAPFADDRRAGAGEHQAGGGAPSGHLGGAGRPELPGSRRRVPPPDRRRPRPPGDGRAARHHPRGRVAAGDADADLRADPRPVRVPPGSHLCRLDRPRPARRRRRRLPGLRPPGSVPAAPPRYRRPLRLRLPVRGRQRRRSASRSRSTPTPGSRRSCRCRAKASRCGWAPIPRTGASPARTTSRSGMDVSTPTSRRSRASTAEPPPPPSRRASR